MCAMNLKKHLEENHILDKAFGTFQGYDLVLTGNMFSLLLSLPGDASVDFVRTI